MRKTIKQLEEQIARLKDIESVAYDRQKEIMDLQNKLRDRENNLEYTKNALNRHIGWKEGAIDILDSLGIRVAREGEEPKTKINTTI